LRLLLCAVSLYFLTRPAMRDTEKVGARGLVVLNNRSRLSRLAARQSGATSISRRWRGFRRLKRGPGVA
jgi:hypothetical protein